MNLQGQLNIAPAAHIPIHRDKLGNLHFGIGACLPVCMFACQHGKQGAGRPVWPPAK